MSFEQRGEAVVSANTLADLKLVYRVLHRHLGEHTELMDTDFLIDLQDFLHQAARAEGVDTADHGAWDAWLGNQPASCAVRTARRSRIDPSH